MSGFAVKGWCPDAWRPMAAGDGLLVRVRPPMGRMTPAQLRGLCDAAALHGNGLLDLTRRANLQIRGVAQDRWPELLDRLVALGLVDADPLREARRNILTAPAWHDADDTARIAQDLTARLGELPELPGKAGFVIDAGPAPALLHEPGDFRIERGVTGRLILRADARPTGVTLAPGEEAAALIALARWFIESGGRPAGRMARHDARLPLWAQGEVAPAAPAPQPTPGAHPQGTALAVPFGAIAVDVLNALARLPGLVAVRLTPWRMLIAEGLQGVTLDGLPTDPAHPLLRAQACPGAPACPQATVETRGLARQLAALARGRVHVSGCAKGCALGEPADVVLTGRDGAYDLSHGTPAGASPVLSGMTRAEILAHFGAA